MTSRKGLALAAIDLLGALFLIALVQMGAPLKPKASTPTYGRYAVTITWPAKCDADEDLYVRDPAGNITYFAAKESPATHLESDTIPNSTGYERGSVNFERVVIRIVEPGEWMANVHTYNVYDCPSAPITVQLWKLQGDDQIVYERKFIMHGQGDERTAFRFSLRQDGSLYGINLLPRSLIQ